ncbi:hypothetical protein [Kitasatospora sp. NPDC127116]|uniref:hypothetical protein n=1 Tax=Kitasatospora sp. NPDC127116 TaxID=3345367 RepID=UPI0036274D65
MGAEAAPYCTDEQCIEDECSPQDPCCTAVCECSRAERDCAYAGKTGDTQKFDGVVLNVWYCPEHKKEWVE